MKRSIKSMLGVTLLEIMLVLAIAAMVIVMSVKYYQSASANEKINTALDQVTGIVASVESYLTASGTLSGMTSTALLPYLSGNKMPFSPWGGAITVSGTGPSIYTIILPSVPGGSVCTELTGLLGQNSKLSVNGTCPTTVGSVVGLTITVTE